MALIIAFIGFVLTAVNHFTVMNERHFYPMLLLFGPVCILFGVIGAIEPRIMNQTGIQTGHSAAVYRLALIGIVLFGMTIGWSLAHFWYGIWKRT